MSLYDRYIAVDWSASNVPRQGRDSIWIGEVARRGTRLQQLPSRNPRTRSAAMVDLVATLLQARDRGERVMLGFDFVFGYPAGAATAIAGRADWRALWEKLAELVEDDDSNRSNRFDAAARINLSLGAAGPRYWGHPPGRTIAGLTPTRPLDCYRTVPERRLAEARVRGPQPVWKLTGVGSVGSQSLLGIARLERLRRDPRFPGQLAVWPFETDFDRRLDKPVTIVEIYPSLFGVTAADGAPLDRAQVEISARRFGELDVAGTLGAFLAAPAGLGAAERAAVMAEEGWIAGVGHAPAVLRAPPAPGATDYLRDPAAIYAESFATIRAEADLSHLPSDLHDVAIRMIHACGMTDLAADIAADPALVGAARAALRAGAPILCDCEMVRSGIIRSLLPAANELVVTLNEPDVPELAAALGTTRSAAALEHWRGRLAGAVVVIGNAPTALFRLLELLAEGAPRPAAIIATPVGFVGAAESKAALAAASHGVPWLTVRGRRGGSAIAGAACNAIARGLAA